MTVQVKLGLLKSDRSSQKIFDTKFFGLKIFLDLKLPLRMEFDSGVGPTFFFVFWAFQIDYRLFLGNFHF